MRSAVQRLTKLESTWMYEPRALSTGRIVEIDEAGRAWVDFPGNVQGPIEARSLVQVEAGSLKCGGEGIPVLLAFENEDPSLPIVVGLVRRTLLLSPRSETAERPDGVELPVERPRDALLDGRRIVLDAESEIVLRCGKASITLRKDGKVVVKGTNIVSRASATNKIKGGSVNIN